MLIPLQRTTERVFSAIPESLILLLARFALAAVFWMSGQTKIEGFALNPFSGTYEFGWPSIKESTFFLFDYEYALPLIPANIAAYMATTAEHILPILLLTGLLTRLSAFGILMMTLVIQLFVYPSAYATHATWGALALLLMYRGGGAVSIDQQLLK